MSRKSLRVVEVFTLIVISLLLVSCGKPKPITMKNGEDISKILENSFYKINTKEMQYYTSKDLIDNDESGVYPTVTVLENNSTSSLMFQYAGEDWVFADRITVKTDKHKYKLDFEPSEVSRNESVYSSDVTERVLFNVGREEYDMLVDMVNSQNTSVIFSGDESYSFELTNRNKELIKLFLSCFEEK